jgi:hypothetical protein
MRKAYGSYIDKIGMDVKAGFSLGHIFDISDKGTAKSETKEKR